MNVVGDVVAFVAIAGGQPEARFRQNPADEVQGAEVLAFAPGGAEVVCGDANEPGPAKRAAATGQRCPLGAFDIHLKEIDPVDSVFAA
jgi:hypothetical protein